MKTRIDSSLLPLPAVIGLWLFVMFQAVGIWFAPHHADAPPPDCAHVAQR